MTETTQTDPPIAPRYVAQAISDLAHETLMRAWHYLLDWYWLEVAKVPPHIRRAGLLVPPDATRLELGETRDTESLRLALGWQRAGLGGVLIGGVGCGKSHASMRWLLEFARAGRSCRWTQAGSWSPNDAFDRERAECQAAHAVVIDDVGAGNMSAWTLESVNALICERHDNGRPTMLASNASTFSVRMGRGGDFEDIALLDDRTYDRLSRDHVRRVAGASLRGSNPSVGEDFSTLDSAGRGKAWKRAAAMLEAIGVTDVGSRPLRPGTPGASYDARDVVFGGSLCTRISAEGNHHAGRRAVIFRACQLLGVDPRAASERARELEATSTDRDAVETVREAMAKLADGVRLAAHDQQRKADEARAKRDADRESWLAARRKHVEELQEQAADVDQERPLPGLSRDRLVELGLAVKQRPEGWEVRFKKRVLADRIPSESDAWTFGVKVMQP